MRPGSVHVAGRKLVGNVVTINEGRRRSGREFELGIATGHSEDGTEAPGKRVVTACVDGGICRRLGFVAIPVPPTSTAPAGARADAGGPAGTGGRGVFRLAPG